MVWKPWNDLSAGTSGAGLANYGVSGYAFKKQPNTQGTQHVVYQGRVGDGSGDGYIHELYSDAAGGTWHHHNLIPDAGGPQTCDIPYLVPSGYAFEQQGTQHVLYQGKIGGGTDGHIHELWWDDDDGWHHHDLNDAGLGYPPISLNPFGYEFSGSWGGQQFVVYKGKGDEIRELRWDAHDGKWHHWSLHEATEGQGAPLAANLPPTAYVFNSQWRQRHVLYVGTDQLVHEFYWEPSGHWHHGALTAAATAHPANGIPTGFAGGGRQFVHFRGTDRHIIQLSWDENAGWRPRDLTDNFGGPLALDAPATGYVFPFAGELEMHVQYLGEDSHIHEYWWDGGRWQHRDLTNLTGAPVALTGPSAYVLGNTQHVVFIARNHHIIELRWEP
jgi:hypothetical protein